jgi:hypothetical protein
MRLKRYNNFLTEGLGDDNMDQFENYGDIKSDILNMIEDSLDSSDMNVISEFINSYITEPDSNNIEGLINDSDIYEFYLKYINEIDEILVEKDYLEKSPESLGALGLYDYLVKATKDCIFMLVEMIKSDLDLSDDDDQENEE